MLYQTLVTIAFLSSFSSCMPERKNDSSGNPQPGRQPTPSSNQPSQGSGSSGAANKSALSDIGADKLLVTQNNVNRSLAEIAKNNRSELTLFEFAGPTCESCKVEGPKVTQVLTQFGSRVSRVVVFANGINEFSASEYLQFTRTYAANAPYAIDGSLTVIKHIRSQPSQYFGVYVIVSKSGLGQILNADQAYMDVEGAIKSVLQN